MRYKFNVNMSEQDYVDFNMFWQTKSPYGKNLMVTARILMAVFFLVAAVIALLNDPSLITYIFIVLLLIVCVIFELLFNRFVYRSTKFYITKLSKKGKMAYSSSSVIEFGEDGFTETTPDNKTEQKYTSIERISVLEKVVYIHVNNIMAYMLPKSSFESKEQYKEFMEFIKTKCSTIDIY